MNWMSLPLEAKIANVLQPKGRGAGDEKEKGDRGVAVLFVAKDRSWMSWPRRACLGLQDANFRCRCFPCRSHLLDLAFDQQGVSGGVVRKERAYVRYEGS